MMAAPAILRKTLCGRVVHWKIWIGNTVNFEKSPVGSTVMKVDAPTTTKGAVSPMARDMERIVPVRMPGRALGNT